MNNIFPRKVFPCVNMRQTHIIIWYLGYLVDTSVFCKTWPINQDRDQTFKEVLESGRPPVPAEQQFTYLVQFWLNHAESLRPLQKNCGQFKKFDH